MAAESEMFPASARVVYEKAPLIQVVCQLRFPTLLTIESKPPADFQERIRGDFPLLEKTSSGLPGDLPPEVAQIIRSQMGGNAYQFLTEDRSYSATLTPDSMAMSTTKYTEWGDFRNRLHIPLSALNEIYKPNYFSRIGLRYQNAIDREELGLGDTPWSELLRTEVLGELALPQFERNLEPTLGRTMRVKIPDGSGSILMRHGLGKVQNRKGLAYLIDLDFFVEKRTEASDAERTLDHFNTMAGRAFRWYITDRLRNALRPREIAAVPA